MKHSLKLLILGTVACFTLYGETWLDKQEFMDLKEVKLRFGDSAFDPTRFKQETTENRAKMAYQLIESKRYVGKTNDIVIQELGQPTGHFWSDYLPSYLLNEGWKTRSDVWQLVFLLDDNKKIIEVRVHKNCCPKN